jgi:hypothetical protein
MSEQQGRVYPDDVVISALRPASRLLLALLVPALLAACTEQNSAGVASAGLESLKPAPQQEQARQQQLEASTASVQPEPPPPPPVAVVDESSVEEAALAVVEEEVESMPEPTPEPAQELAPRTLDLAYKPGATALENPGQENYGGDQKWLLPNLFDQDKAGRKVSVSGGVMLDHEQQEVRDAVTGGEVSVKIKTP